MKLEVKLNMNPNGKSYIEIQGKEFNFDMTKVCENYAEFCELKIKELINENIYSPFNKKTIEDTLFKREVNNLIKAIVDEKTINFNYRGVGKSAFIKALAKEFDLPIVVKRPNTPNTYNYNREELNVHSIDNVSGISNRKLVLVDEVDIEDVCKLREQGFNVAGIIREKIFY